MFDEGEYYYSATDVFSSCLSSISNNSSNKKKMINRRRFTDKQVRSLESIFENETKLEPKKKVQVAKELGLQPRQVAIWFQNKRARYKSKQLERDFSLLRANYNALASQFESLKKEKHSLFLQLKKLKDEMAGNKQEEREDCKENKLENEECSKNNSEEREVKPTMSMEGSDYGASILSSDEGSSENTNNNNTNNDNNNLGMERETEEIDDMLTSMMEPTNNTVGSSLTTSDHEANCWEDYPPEPEGLFDQQAVDSCCHWWDFWS